jgi:peptide-methionine (S)-S-oxide reductase
VVVTTKLALRTALAATTARVATAAVLATTAVLATIALLALTATVAAEPEPTAAAQSPAEPADGPATATLAGGCFWCVEEAFEEIEGVKSVTSGYTGGSVANPTYEQVGEGATGHFEAVQIVFDPKRVSYEKLLDVFWHNVDPTDAQGQFCDKGPQYRSAIFVADDEQRRIAEASKRAIDESGRFPGKVATEIRPAGPFYPAEEYHQDYAEKNPIRYRFYRTGCGRDARLREVWGAPGE